MDWISEDKRGLVFLLIVFPTMRFLALDIILFLNCYQVSSGSAFGVWPLSSATFRMSVISSAGCLSNEIAIRRKRPLKRCLTIQNLLNFWLLRRWAKLPAM